MKTLFNYLVLTVFPSLLFGNQPLYAMDFDPYLRLEASKLNVKIADVDFYPELVRGGLGLFLWQGVGFEVQGGLLTREDIDEDSSIYVDTDGYESVALRLQSPFEAAWAAYVTLGYAKFDLKSYQKAPMVVTFDDQLKSGFATIGFEKQVGFYPKLSYAISYEHMFDDDLVEIRALNFSYRFAFGEQ